MQIENISVRALRPYAGNARRHSKKQLRQIASSIERFGFCNPVLIDDHKQIIAGHGRVEAAKLIGIKEVPTVRLSHLMAPWSATRARASALEIRRTRPPSRTLTVFLKTSSKSMEKLLRPLGRPFRLPDWPFLNRVLAGGCL